MPKNPVKSVGYAGECHPRLIAARVSEDDSTDLQCGTHFHRGSVFRAETGQYFSFFCEECLTREGPWG